MRVTVGRFTFLIAVLSVLWIAIWRLSDELVRAAEQRPDF